MYNSSKFIVAKENRIGLMRLFGVIDSNGIMLNQFISEFESLQNDPDVDEIEILINSRGGSVFDGFPIYNQISTSKKPVTTIVDTIGASMGAIIALAGSTRKMYEHGQLMLHSASIEGDSNSQEDPAVINTNKTIFDIIKKVTKQVKSVVTDWLSKDTWFNAQQAKDAGLIDEIIPTIINAEYLSSYRNDVQLIVAQANGDDEHLNNLKEKYQSKKMIEVINELKLDDKATEKDIVAKIKEVNAKVAELENQLTVKEAELVNRDNVISELTNKVTVFENAEKEKRVNEINALIETAFAERKINAVGKETWKSLLTIDFENGKKALSNLVKPEKISDAISNEGEAAKQPQMILSDIQKLNQNIFA